MSANSTRDPEATRESAATRKGEAAEGEGGRDSAARPGVDSAPQIDPGTPAESAPGAGKRNRGVIDLYRTKEVVEILRISRRQLQYWAQTDLVVPSVKTRGGHHRYTFEDLVALKATKRLIDAGVSVQRIRNSIQGLRRLLPNVESPLSDLVLVATGDVVLVFMESTAFEAVSGQEWVFEVAHFEREVAAWRSATRGGELRKARPVRPSPDWVQTA
jgi:DNA-binding transcriptional MerR regulator